MKIHDLKNPLDKRISSRLQGKSPRTQQGFSLLELMIALTIMAVGLLGQISLQSETLTNNSSSFMRSQAAFLANDILDRIRANPQGLFDDDYNDIDTREENLPEAACINTEIGCDSSDLATDDIYQWQQNVQNYLIDGIGIVSIDNEDNVTISIEWGNQLKRVDADSSAAQNRLDMTLSL